MARRTVVGLDIGTSAVRAAQVRVRGDVRVLERFGQVALPPGAVKGGEVQAPDVVAAAVRQLWAQLDLRQRDVVVGVANQRVVVRQVDLPWMPPDELRSSLPLQVQDVVPMPVDQAVLDHYPLQELTSDSGVRTQRVLLVAASREMVGSTIDAVARAGLRPVCCDLTSFALLRGLVTPELLERGTAEAVVDIGADVTNIVVHSAGRPRFVRILLMGGHDVTEAVSERLGVDPASAEELKRATGLHRDPQALVEDPAGRAVELSGASFVEEVRGSLDYYVAQPGALPVSRIVLSGGGSRLQGLAHRLALATRLPVEPAAPLSGLVRGRTGLSDQQLDAVEPLLPVVVGLATQVAA